MSYFGFLALFIGVPLIILAFLTWRDAYQGRNTPKRLSSYSPWIVLFAHVLVAVIYTTPWDNYLVATSVWWYDPDLVTGITLGWVPIEEYTFFVVQTLFTGLWLLFWARRWARWDESKGWENGRLRSLSVLFLAFIWLINAIVLAIGWQPGTYLALQLTWALVPVMIQLGFGADILWRYRSLVAVGLIPTTLYLAFADALAIQSGTWTIDPVQSVGWLLGGVLPIEEFLFFFLTNLLVVFGVTLVLAEESQKRVEELGLKDLLMSLSKSWRLKRS
ncbi:MAG: lycopene cyclase domain-containing protein [Chloroflexota bacterium]